MKTTTTRMLRSLAGAAMLTVLGATAATAQVTGDRIPTDSGGDLIVHPLTHATMALAWNAKTIYVDPAPAPGSPQGSDGAAAFAGMPEPDLILVTDIHGDHFNAATLEKLTSAKSTIVAPEAVADQLPETLKGKTKVLANGATTEVAGISVEAVPMYNTTQDRLQFHAKGRGNGYVITLGGKRVYIAGDTEDVPEMRALQDIDVAFIPMNLPYTMTPEQAAAGVLAFKPDVVYPYHYGQSDLSAFTKAVAAGDSDIEVRVRNWYQ